MTVVFPSYIYPLGLNFSLTAFSILFDLWKAFLSFWLVFLWTLQLHFKFNNFQSKLFVFSFVVWLVFWYFLPYVFILSWWSQRFTLWSWSLWLRVRFSFWCSGLNWLLGSCRYGTLLKSQIITTCVFSCIVIYRCCSFLLWQQIDVELSSQFYTLYLINFPIFQRLCEHLWGLTETYCVYIYKHFCPTFLHFPHIVNLFSWLYIFS